MMGLPQEKSGLAVLLRFTLLSSGGSDAGEPDSSLYRISGAGLMLGREETALDAMQDL